MPKTTHIHKTAHNKSCWLPCQPLQQVFTSKLPSLGFRLLSPHSIRIFCIVCKFKACYSLDFRSSSVEDVGFEASNLCCVLFCVCVAFSHCMYLLLLDTEPVSVGFWTLSSFWAFTSYNALVHSPFTAVRPPAAIVWWTT